MKNLKGTFAIILLTSAISFCVSAQNLRVMTYNVHNGVGLDRQRDHERIAQVIKKQMPDVVAIQEVDSMTQRCGHSYVLGEIASAAGMHEVYAPAIDFDGGRYGIGLLSKTAPDSCSFCPLPGREEKRMMLVADFKDYSVICTHLSLTPDDALLSTAFIHQALAARRDRPVILMGDLNSRPESKVIEILSHDFLIVNDQAVPTFPAHMPNRCIDYIMVASPYPITVSSSEVVPDTIASDHRPVTATIKIAE